jgi:hypothetical protein
VGLGQPRCRALAAALCCLAALAFTGGCEDRPRLAGEQGLAVVERLLPLVERDTKQVREGIPEGAKKIAPLLDAEPGADLASLQRAIQKARAAVEGLTFAKSTFFVFVEPSGMVVRSEVDPDLAAGQSLTEPVPEAKKLFEPGAKMVELFGRMHGFRGVQNGSDRQWIVGHPVEVDGKLKGAFVTGWSLRSYAHYLEEDTRRYLVKSQGDKPKAIPLVYVFIVHGGEAFGAPVTPDVNAEAVAKLDPVGKSKTGTFQAELEIEKRAFVVVAKPCPALGPEVAIAALVGAQ